MQTSILGRTGLEVSRIALGTWQFSGKWGEYDREDALELIRHAYNSGINFFDTAHAYGFGLAEQVLGDALVEPLRQRRDEVVIATKGGVRGTDAGNVRDASPNFLREGLEHSLRALGVDHVDIFLVHWPDGETPIAETAGTVAAFIAEGKVRFAGVSNYQVPEMEEFSRTTPVSVLQPPYSLLRRGIEDEVLPYCQGRGIGCFVYGTLAHGLLSGRHEKSTRFPESDWRSKSPVFRGRSFRKNVAMVQKLEVYAEHLGVGLPELVSAWAIHRPGVDCAIVGGKSRQQVAAALRAGTLELGAAEMLEIEAIAREGVPVGGPSPEKDGVPD
jgi:aryl-alcohol dehydrogenase-like predicted oxidoreductase